MDGVADIVESDEELVGVNEGRCGCTGGEGKEKDEEVTGDAPSRDGRAWKVDC